VQILEKNRADVPAALAFLGSPDRRELAMCQASGVHPATEKAWAVAAPDSALPLWAVQETGENQRVPISGSAFEDAFLPDPVSGTVPTEAMVLPLAAPDGAPIGTLVLGFSACRPPDDGADFFFDLVARQVSTALWDALAYQSVRERTANLEIALASNRQIGVAIGILMHHERITEVAAFDRLRTTSQDLNRKLRDVAEEVTLTGRLPESRSPQA
jgi:GAF domain-containing protein